MTTWGILGDIHGASLDPFLDQIDAHDIEGIVCTGDFDQVRAVNAFRELAASFTRQGRPVVAVAGNHDQAIYQDRELAAGSILLQDKTFPELVTDLREDPAAMEYVGQLLEEDVLTLTLSNGLETAVVHGALAGNLRSYPECPPEDVPRWARLWYEEDYTDNFDAMRDAGHDVMIRGHDHDPEYVRQAGGEPEFHYPDPGDSFPLTPGCRYTITHGAWYDGWYATLADTGTPRLTFRRTSR